MAIFPASFPRRNRAALFLLILLPSILYGCGWKKSPDGGENSRPAPAAEAPDADPAPVSLSADDLSDIGGFLR